MRSLSPLVTLLLESGITPLMPTKLFDAGAPDVLYVVDLSSYLLRAYHAVAPLSSPKGEPTHAVHGTVTMLERLFRERRPQLLCIAMDSGRETFRKELYAAYKENRPPAPEDLRVQMRRAEEIVRAWGLSVQKQDGVEADDLIAAVTRRSLEAGRRVVIVSADKDLMQLIGPGVVMWDTLRNKVFGPEEVEERFQVRPEQLGDLLALMGDSSDNIPGVPSVGPKTAATLIQEYGSLDGIFTHLDSIAKKKLKETLAEHEENARLSRKLVALKDDCDVDVSEAALAFSPRERRDETRLIELYEELGFTRQLAALRSGTASIQTGGKETQTAASPTPKDDATAQPESSTKELSAAKEFNSAALAETRSSITITDQQGLAALITELGNGTWSMEILTLRPDAHRGPIIAASFSSEGADYYLPFEHRYVGTPVQLGAIDTLRTLLNSLKKGQAKICLHDIKRTLVMLGEAGIEADFRGAHDTMLGSYLLDPERNHGLPALASNVSLEVPDYDQFAKEGRRKRTFDEIEVEPAAKYATTRALAIRLEAARQQELLDQEGLRHLLHDVELPLAHLLAELERRGVLVDTARLTELSVVCAKELAELEQEAHRSAGKEFNVNSPRQLESILFDDLGLKPLKRTKTSRSTDAQTLEALAEEHDLPDIILKIRQVAKLKGTYIDALPALVSAKTGRIHGAWEQAVAATGRLSSTDPNLQNIPIRSELGRQIRAAFVASPGHHVVSADYSQIELRVLAHLSQDERLVEAFQTGQDVHARTAMEIFEVAEDQITREMRTRAKAVNFGVIYGQGESGLAKSLGIERSEAARFIAAYFRRYDGVRTFMEQTLESARQGEAVRSILGRRRTVPDIKSGNRARRLAAERIAMNMPIQGSAADILKLAMLKLKAPVTPGTKMVLTVHDELVFEIPESELEEACPRIKTAMESAYQLCVPLTVDIGHGANWNAAH